MTFLQSTEPAIVNKRIYRTFSGMNNGPLPSEWMKRKIQGNDLGPEVANQYMSCGITDSLNTNTRWIAALNEQVNTDDQVIRGTVKNAVNGLLGGICLKMNAAMTWGVMGVLSTGTDRGIWSIQNGAASRVATFSGTQAVNDTWALEAEGDYYTLIRNPNYDGTGGSPVLTWHDSTGSVRYGEGYRYGGFFVNSDRNVFGTRNWGPGWDQFDFRDLGWTP